MDTINRDSLACDLMEPIRPDVDAYVLSRIVRQPLKRNWFFEERNGNCRLMADLASKLAETASTWARLVAPLAEWTTKQIASTTRTSRKPSPATRLTQRHKRALTDGIFPPAPKPPVKLQIVCRACGDAISDGHEKCVPCSLQSSTQNLIKAAVKGRIASHTSEAEAKRSMTQLINHSSRQEWSQSNQPSWLTPEFYAETIQPLVASSSSQAIARRLAVSRGYATEIRHGRVPHPRHWLALAEFAGLSKLSVHHALTKADRSQEARF
jgi:hypothetical protein